MTKLSKERLEEIHAEYSRPNHSKSFSVKDLEIAEMTRRLLEAETQEPVYQVLDDGSWTDYSKEQLDILLESKPSTLSRVAYAAPQLPQPAVPDVEPYLHGLSPHAADALIRYSEACRAALLKQPSTIQTSDSACSGGEIKQSASKSVQVPEWTNEQCLEFLSIAFRHAEIKGDLELDDIRLGVKMTNAMLSAPQPESE